MLSSHSGRDLLLGALETVVQNAFEGKRLWAENKGGITGFGYLLESTLSDTSLSDFRALPLRKCTFSRVKTDIPT